MNGIGIGIGRKRKNWTPDKPLGGETPNFWVKSDSRSGLSLIDSVTPENSPEILPSFLYRPDKSKYSYIQDMGALDPGTEDYTIGCWIKGETADSGYGCPVGKIIQGDPVGEYGFVIQSTTGILRAYLVSTGGAKVIADNVSVYTTGWRFIIYEIDYTNLKLRFFKGTKTLGISQVGSDTAFTGTIPYTGDAFKFMLGSANNTDGTGAYILASVSLADVIVLNRKLTATEKTNCLSGVYPVDLKAYWPCNNHLINDVSGNAYHMTGVGLTTMNVGYISNGSRQCIDKGYSLYKREYYPDLQIPYTIAGVAIISPSITSGYAKHSDIAADLQNHNLADSMIQFISAEWDRSDILIWSDLARGVYYNSTSAITVKQWHITELTRENIYNWLNEDYREESFIKFCVNSINNRLELKELISYNTPKSGANVNTILKYTGDYGIVITPNRPIYVAGVCLMVDDTSRTATWKAADDVLTPSHAWKLTCFLNGTQDAPTIANIGSLIANGHEIANHSVHHIDWETYLLTHTVEEFFNTEIAPQQTTIYNAYGITPSCYGYAQVLGRNEELNTYILAHGFTHVRPASNRYPSHMDFDLYGYNGANDGVIECIYSDFFNTNDALGNAEIIKYLQIAKNSNKIICIVMHTIDMTNTTNGSNSIKLSRVQALCDYVNANGMKFYGMSELVPSLFGL